MKRYAIVLSDNLTNQYDTAEEAAAAASVLARDGVPYAVVEVHALAAPLPYTPSVPEIEVTEDPWQGDLPPEE